jgi:alpha-galactosidase
MRIGNASRRDFLKTAAAVAILTTPSISSGGQAVRARHHDNKRHGLDLLRSPDHISARFGTKEVVRMEYAAHAWTCSGVQVSAEPVQTGALNELPIRVANEGKDLTYIHIRWKGKESDALLSIGDHWERSYGDLEWQGTIPDRVMPWYFLTYDGEIVNGYGVKTQPSAFCFWQCDAEGITLSIDLRNGGEATVLGDRELHACTVVTRMGQPRETISQAGHEFCRHMCPSPRLPKGPLFGVNDWNYAYGNNTAAGIRRDRS